MKKYLLSCIAFSVLLFTGCADENMPTTSTESTEPGITVSMDLAANLETRKCRPNKKSWLPHSFRHL